MTTPFPPPYPSILCLAGGGGAALGRRLTQAQLQGPEEGEVVRRKKALATEAPGDGSCLGGSKNPLLAFSPCLGSGRDPHVGLESSVIHRFLLWSHFRLFLPSHGMDVLRITCSLPPESEPRSSSLCLTTVSSSKFRKFFPMALWSLSPNPVQLAATGRLPPQHPLEHPLGPPGWVPREGAQLLSTAQLVPVP